MAKRRTTAKQKVASRRNLVKARRKRSVLSSRNLKIGTAAFVGAAAVIGTGIGARKVYNNQFITYYHATSKKNVDSIAKHGLRAPANDKWRSVFFTNKNPLKSASAVGEVASGNEVFGVKIKKSLAKRVFKPDPFQGLGIDPEEMVPDEKWVMIHERHLKRFKVHRVLK